MTKPLLAILLLLPLPISDIAAHSGGLDSNGCHAGSQPYHCHRSPGDMAGNRLRCDLGSRLQNARTFVMLAPVHETTEQVGGICVRLVLVPPQLNKWVLRA